MRIAIIGGGGYVGLVTGLGFAELGNEVVCVDVDRDKVDQLRCGKSPIYEQGIDGMLRRNLQAGRVSFSTEIGPAVSQSDVVFVAVGTPSALDGNADLSQVIEAAETVACHLNSYKVIVIKSTVPVGTVELVRGILRREYKEGHDFDVVSNPEFLREGRGLYDFLYPNRIVVGSCSERASGVMRDLYAPLVDGSVVWDEEPPPANRELPVPIVDTDLASAQMIKYACNAFLATRVSFINEIASLCERVGAHVGEVARGMGYDPRIGHAYLEAGIGFGGPCLEKDLHALIKIAYTTGYDSQLLRAVMMRNDRQVEEIVAKLKAAVGYLLYRKVVAVWGTAFKGGTNDVRNSQALKVIARIEAEGAQVQSYDPAANAASLAAHPTLRTFDDPYAAARHAEALLILADWPEFRKLDLERAKREMAAPVILDGRNLLSPGVAAQAGFRYTGVGLS